MHEADQVAPGEAVLHDGDGTVADRCPDAPKERLEPWMPHAMLVGRPEFHARLGIRRGYRADERADLF
jgi:hypothetical protein